MKIQTIARNFCYGVMATGVIAFASGTFAEDASTIKSKDQAASKIEMHEHMADMHKKAADCLKSGKPETECQKAMMAECKDYAKNMKGSMNCPMMGNMMKMHHGMNGDMSGAHEGHE